MKHKILRNKILGIFTIAISLLTGCSFNPEIEVPAPVVAEKTVYFYTLCHFNAVDEKTGALKWKLKTVNSKEEDFCKEKE